MSEPLMGQGAVKGEDANLIRVRSFEDVDGVDHLIHELLEILPIIKSLARVDDLARICNR
jgi:hypothetical protein